MLMSLLLTACVFSLALEVLSPRAEVVMDEDFCPTTASSSLQGLFADPGVIVEAVRNLWWPRLLEDFTHKNVSPIIIITRKLIATDTPIAIERRDVPRKGVRMTHVKMDCKRYERDRHI